MAGPSPLFDITIWMERSDDPAAVHDALVEALGEQAPLLARGVRATERGVMVEFPEMKGPRPGAGEQASPEAVDHAERILPIVKALVALSAARVQSGLAPGERIVIEVRPSAVHPQDELRHT